MNIIVDAFGGDNAPLEVIKGSMQAVRELKVNVTLAGNEKLIKKCAEENGLSLEGIEILHAEDIFDIHEEPVSLIKEHKNSSMAVGMQALADGNGDAFVSAGSSGALVVGSTFIVKRIKGIKRVALAPVMPTGDKPFLLLDGGANNDCRPEMLQQFAIMGSAYMEKVMGVDKPRVKLLNVGAEETKGRELELEAYKLLQNTPVNFCGNIEARELPLGNADVVVADGFTGNVALKLYEGMGKFMKDQLKGNVKFVFQPNEEDAGAEAMIEAGVLDNPKVDFCFGVHLWQPTPDGKLGLQPGAVMAGQDNFKITITGKGGHSGEPHKTIDPVLAAATVIINLQAIQTRQINVLNPTALMVNTLQAGTAPNVVGDVAVIGGSLRYLYDPSDSLEARPRVRMKQIAESTCAVFGAECKVEFLPSSKTLINSENAVARIRPVAEAVFGQENIIPSVFMMGEDFASFTEAVPGAFAFVGVGSEEKGLIWPHHHQKFDIDEDAMSKGVELFVRLALDYLS
jgi:glycerol-3-phosphate acyltransferase PlsX